MTKASVSVVMSVYNAEHYLDAAINSILRQSHEDFEFIIVNDASTDGSCEILAKQADPRIRIITNEARGGLSVSLNRAIACAKGDVIVRMDADDIAHPRRIEKQLAFLRRNPQVGFLCSWVQCIDEKGRRGHVWNPRYTAEEIFYRLHYRNCLNHPSAMFRKEIFDAVGGYDESLPCSQDYALWCKFAQVVKMAVCPEVLLYFRKTQESISGSMADLQKETTRALAGTSLIHLSGLSLSQHEVDVLQFYETESRTELIRTLDAMDLIDQSIIEKERSIIEMLGLSFVQVNRAMRKHRRELLHHRLKRILFSSRVALIRILFRRGDFTLCELVRAFMKASLAKSVGR